MPDPTKHSNNYLIVICGPTASGKSECAIELAQHYQTEILSTDSRQIYKELNIGTAKPKPQQLISVPHHFIDTVSIHEEYSAGQYERDGLSILDQLFQTNNIAIAAGGTGLYIKALIRGFDDIPNSDASIRAAIIKEYEEHGLEFLQQEAEAADPVSFAEMDIQNPQRLMRLIEIFRSTGKPKSSFIKKAAKERPFQTIKIGLQIEREALYNRINQRVDKMMENGLLEEVRQLHSYKSLNALQTVGYSDLMKFLDGEIDLEAAVELIKRNSRRYAKRQMTWFRGDDEIKWFAPTDIQEMIKYIDHTTQN